jgi:porin
MFKQNFFGDVLEWKLGLIPIGQDFGNFYKVPFENLTLTSGTTGNVAGYSQFNWPVSQWATDLRINLTRTLAVKIGLFAFNNYWISRDYYLRVDNPGGTSGAVIPVEINWKPKLHIFGKDLPGEWNFTIYGNTNNQQTTGAAKSWLGSAPGVPPGLLGSRFTGDYGYAASIWQQVTAPDPNRSKTGLTLFASNTWADPRTALQNLQDSAGPIIMALGPSGRTIPAVWRGVITTLPALYRKPSDDSSLPIPSRVSRCRAMSTSEKFSTPLISFTALTFSPIFST